MFYDPRMRGLGRGVHKTRRKVKREDQEQDVFTMTDMKYYDDGSTNDDDSPSGREINEDGTGNSEADSWSNIQWGSGMEDHSWSASPSPTSTSSNSLGSCPYGDDQSTLDPRYGWSSSHGPVDAACGTSSVRTDAVFQTALAEIANVPSSDSQLSSPASETTSAIPSTTSTRHNTWITDTSPISAPSMTASTSSPSRSHSSSSSTTSSVPQSASSAAASVPRVVHVDGLSPSDRAGTIAGITVGIAVVILLVVVAALAYVRGGRMRGLSSDEHFSSARLVRKRPPSLQSRQGGTHQQGMSLDVEHGSGASGSRRTEEKDNWEDVDLRGVEKSNTKGDDVRWWEAWCRDKENMTARPPELRFNPELPLPPIILVEGTEREN